MQDEAVVDPDSREIVAARMMNLCATFDHRFIDGFQAAALGKVIRRVMEHPFENFKPIPGR